MKTNNSIRKNLISFFLVVFFAVAILNIKIENISFEGNTRISDSDIAKELFVKDYDSISLVFFMKNKLAKKKNMQLINDYNIEWLSPFTVVVHVDEKSAVAFVRRDINNLYFDVEGEINEISNNRHEGVVEVSGVDFKNYQLGEKLKFDDSKLLEAILNISNFLKENDLPANLIEIEKGTEIYIYIGSIIVNMGNAKNMEIKLQRLFDIYPQIKDLNGTLDLSEAKENMLDEQYIFKKNN